jgi:sigma-B regulation protein RsbU (phosphoserine phosphatase)
MFNGEEQGRMTCMEVWGGNVQTERRFETSGLDVWISSQPEGQSQAGGDVYYVSSCASGRITRLMLADVSGHGQMVADVATRLRDLMRNNVNTIGNRPFVTAMNRNFADETDGLRFATAIVSSYFSPTRTLSICSAGHPPPLIFRESEQSWRLLDTSDSSRRDPGGEVADLPLGIISNTSYSECTLRLADGDMVLCYSDAFSEAQGADGKMLGIDGLLSVVSSIGSLDAEELLPGVIESLRSCGPTNLNQDDATLLLF